MLSASSVLVLCALQAAAQPAPAKELEAVVVSLKGTVDVKRPEDKDWVAAERNMKLKKGSSICTSVASTAELLFSGNVKVLVRPLTEASIETLAQAGGELKADVNLKFGTVEVDIQKGDLRSDMKVRSPNSTTSVSGSNGIVRAFASGGGALIALRTFTGSWIFNPAKLDVDIFIEGAGAVNEDGDLPQDMEDRFRAELYVRFFGRRDEELYLGRFGQPGGDARPWDVPFFEFVNQSPVGQRTRRPSALPLPPPPPGP